MKEEFHSLHRLSKIGMILGYRHENLQYHKHQEGNLTRQKGPVSPTEKRVNLPGSFVLLYSNHTPSPSLTVWARTNTNRSPAWYPPPPPPLPQQEEKSSAATSESLHTTTIHRKYRFLLLQCLLLTSKCVKHQYVLILPYRHNQTIFLRLFYDASISLYGVDSKNSERQTKGCGTIP